jgi:predicted aldo/keto reductase-like oxidoreductase
VATPKPAVSPRYRVLGQTGLRVSEVGFGCADIHDVGVIRGALERGINFFDTARGYDAGAAEQVLGAALNGRRKDTVLSTRSYAPNAKVMKADLDTSLKELGTDHVDLWYIGNKDKPAEVTDAMLEVQAAAQKAGKIRFRAFSTHRLFDMLPFILKNRFDVVMIPYNFAIGTSRDPMGMVATRLEESLQKLTQAGIGIVAMKAMAGGALARLPAHPLYWVFRRPGSHTAALRWVLRNQKIATIAVRTADQKQLDENVLAMAAPYTEDDRKTLGAYLQQIRPLYCRMCGSCDGVCPRGLPVADMVRFVTYVEGYGQFRMGQAGFERLPAQLKRVRCEDCASCPVACPNGVDVRERLGRAQELFG